MRRTISLSLINLSESYVFEIRTVSLNSLEFAKFLITKANFFSAHIFFDDAYEISDVNDDWMQVNEFVKMFVECVNEAGAYVHQVIDKSVFVA